jgi:TRAP-type C4-dicarboxylate transport system permease large subunit
MAMNTLVVLEIFHLFFIRNIHSTSLTWAAARGTNLAWTVVVAITATQFAVTYLPPLQAVIGTMPVSMMDVLLIVAVLGSIYTGFATATEAAAVGVVGALVLSTLQGSMSWAVFKDALMGATRLYCMIALILAGAAFLTLSMGYIGLPRHLAEWIGGLGLSRFELIMALMVFFIILGCFLDGISMVVLTMGVLMPTVQKAGIDPIWFGIFIVFVVEMAQITPPVGFK